jgi:alkanesulfonate monooxygenase SsuD/methylene tetrahydromethanopterin reductase-like flavin-dependent oxidoreductase (luciferase family)
VTPIRFGLSIPATTAPGADPVGFARRAETLGFDFVSASDHPGGQDPSYETWTLLSWIAAATSTIGIATKVLCLPLRPPALTAKMAETLHRLSGGRLILGLGGGFSDEEMLAFGVGQRTPREKVDGLEEAIHIIRGLWSQPSFTFDGRIYRTDSADIEPKPVTPIPIWLGTFGDRALALTGRLADGWIPSYGYAPPERAVVLRDKMLRAAVAAGRDPAEITCAYHVQVRVGEYLDDPGIISGPAELVADRLRGLISLGFTTFNLSPVGPDTDEQLTLLARHVIPATRPQA